MAYPIPVFFVTFLTIFSFGANFSCLLSPLWSSERIYKLKKLFCYISPSLIGLVVTDHALAVQTHGGSEGLVAHQIGHVLFVVGMATILCMVITNRIHGPGWSSFKNFLFLILCWNLLTFTGHWLNELIDTENFINVLGQKSGFKIESSIDFLFYLSQLDHILLVPALVFLALALKEWSSIS